MEPIPQYPIDTEVLRICTFHEFFLSQGDVVLYVVIGGRCTVSDIIQFSQGPT
jgi:hypothetical protein